MKLNEYKVLAESTLYETLNKINKNGKSIAFVCDDEDHFLGIITDGDARRHLLNGGTINDKSGFAMNRTPFVLYANQLKTVNCHQIMQEKLIKVIPVLAQDGKLIDVISISDEVQTKRQISIPVVIMAGGGLIQ